MTDKTIIAALREAALKATPGKWKLGIGSTYAYVQAAIDMKAGGTSWVKLCHLSRAGWRNQQSTIDDARFISLASPPTIIALIDQIEAERHQQFCVLQKPVISKEKLCDWLEDNFDIDDSQRDAFANCFAHHCNCIVKKED